MRKNDESKQNATLSYELWDDAQDAYLVEHRATQTTLEMAKALGRTYNAVRRRMGRLGIGQNDKLTTAQKRHERRMMDFNDEWRSIIPVNPW